MMSYSFKDGDLDAYLLTEKVLGKYAKILDIVDSQSERQLSQMSTGEPYPFSASVLLGNKLVFNMAYI